MQFTLTHIAGERGKLDKTIIIEARSLIQARDKWAKMVGKLGLVGVYLPEHIKFGYGKWFCASNGGINATYSVTEGSTQTNWKVKQSSEEAV